MEIAVAPTISRLGLGFRTRTGKGSTDPFADINKVAALTPSGNLATYGVEIEDPNSPTGSSIVGRVGADYLLIPNREVIERVADPLVDASSLPFTKDRLFWDGSRMVATYSAKVPLAEVRVGDTVGLGMMIENSYDGSRALRARMYGLQLTCLNGNTSRELFSEHRFRHVDDGGEGWEKELSAALSMIQAGEDSVQVMADRMQAMGLLETDYSTLKAIRAGALAFLPQGRWAEVVDRFLGHEEGTVYGLMNAATNVLWHRDGTLADFDHNRAAVDGLMRFAAERVN